MKRQPEKQLAGRNAPRLKSTTGRNSTLTIFRVGSRHKPFSQLCNEMLRDKRLSLGALGALCFVLSYPENWQFDLGWLQKERGIGRDQARRVINELIGCGYCARRPKQNNSGKFDGYEYVFTDEPAHLVSPGPGNPSGGQPVAGKPVTEKPAPEKPPEKNKYRDTTNKENKEAQPNAAAPKRDNSDLKSEVLPLAGSGAKPQRPSFPKPSRVDVLTPADVQWKPWLAHLDASGQYDKALKARDSGKLTVTTRWPPGANITKGAERSSQGVQ